MCGICVSIVHWEEDKSCKHMPFLSQELSQKLKRRGPDYLEELFLTYEDSFALLFCSSILHLRCSLPSKQPVKDKFGNVLLWNGEIFGGTLAPPKNECDTNVLSEKLFMCSGINDTLDVIASIEGPYAFVFYQANGNMWFGRDIFGRRSLLWNFDKNRFQLCSVAASSTANFQEVPTDGVYCIDLKKSQQSKLFIINKYQWSTSASGLSLNMPSNEITCQAIISMHPVLRLPSPVTSALNQSLPLDAESVSDLNAIKELKCSEHELLSQIMNLQSFCSVVNEFEEVLSNAVRKRVCNRTRCCKKCIAAFLMDKTSATCKHSSIGILFSGGLDSIVLACLVDRHLSHGESVDLINVAFASSLKLQQSKKEDSAFETPDRISGRDGMRALERICSSRKWIFVEVNITDEELASNRKDTISDLLSPSCTVLDDSIGCALWFAARGEGIFYGANGYEEYSSPVRVLLLGMGADEQLAGYSRHRAKFNSGGWAYLIQELSFELDRIGSRNLGRDDRIISDHGVESRYPFLDENVVSFLNSIPVCLKANLCLPRGIGEKLLLRLLAFKLGLKEAAVLPKRAIQFGSRIARMENSNEKGSDICQRLKNL